MNCHLMLDCVVRVSNTLFHAESYEWKSCTNLQDNSEHSLWWFTNTKSPKVITKLYFSDDIITNNWGNKTVSHKSLRVDSSGPHGIDSSLDCIVLNMVSTFSAYRLSYEKSFPLHGLFFLCGTFWTPESFIYHLAFHGLSELSGGIVVRVSTLRNCVHNIYLIYDS